MKDWIWFMKRKMWVHGYRFEIEEHVGTLGKKKNTYIVFIPLSERAAAVAGPTPGMAVTSARTKSSVLTKSAIVSDPPCRRRP